MFSVLEVAYIAIASLFCLYLAKKYGGYLVPKEVKNDFGRKHAQYYSYLEYHLPPKTRYKCFKNHWDSYPPWKPS